MKNALVKEAKRGADGRIIMRGEIYDAEDKKDVIERFAALIKPHKFGGK